MEPSHKHRRRVPLASPTSTRPLSNLQVTDSPTLQLLCSLHVVTLSVALVGPNQTNTIISLPRYLWCLCYRAGRCSCDAPGSYWARAQAEFQQGHRPSWQVVSWFSSVSTDKWRIIPILGRDHFLLHPFHFIIYHPTIRRYNVWSRFWRRHRISRPPLSGLSSAVVVSIMSSSVPEVLVPADVLRKAISVATSPVHMAVRTSSPMFHLLRKLSCHYPVFLSTPTCYRMIYQ